MIDDSVIQEIADRLQRGEPVTVEGERLAALLAAIALLRQNNQHRRDLNSAPRRDD